MTDGEKTGFKGRKGADERPCYVIHEHDASRLHWDLRLEFDGVLKSWALPKEPPTAEGIKRLAIAVDDHPLGYASFQGTIPEGEYGAGTVKIWDSGTFTLIEAKDGEYILQIDGNKLDGRYALIRTGSMGNGKSWLFFRMKEAS